MPARQHRRLRNDFSLGAEDAEGDRKFLEQGFYESGYYRTVKSHDNNRAFIIGRTGSGKSALLRRLEIDLPEHVIRIDPENLSLPYITNLGVIKYLASIREFNLDPLFIALWKHVLIVEIIRHRYDIISADTKQNFIQGIMERVKRDTSKRWRSITSVTSKANSGVKLISE